MRVRLVWQARFLPDSVHQVPGRDCRGWHACVGPTARKGARSAATAFFMLLAPCSRRGPGMMRTMRGRLPTTLEKKRRDVREAEQAKPTGSRATGLAATDPAAGAASSTRHRHPPIASCRGVVHLPIARALRAAPTCRTACSTAAAGPHASRDTRVAWQAGGRCWWWAALFSRAA
jgi:hypothetical protein